MSQILSITRMTNLHTSPSQSPIAWLDNSRLSNCKKQNDITKKPRSPMAPAQQVKTLICLQSIKIS